MRDSCSSFSSPGAEEGGSSELVTDTPGQGRSHGHQRPGMGELPWRLTLPRDHRPFARCSGEQGPEGELPHCPSKLPSAGRRASGTP